jgi:ABC-type dipeptide/oligopeptide/nickel transport system permease component
LKPFAGNQQSTAGGILIGFVGRRIMQVVMVAVAIVFFGYLGVGLGQNSRAARPSYDWPGASRSAWQATQTFFEEALRGDLGSTSTRQGVSSVKVILIDTYPKSMGLLLAALLLSVLIGLTAGTMAALSKRLPLAFPILALTVLGISVPSFFAALLLQIGEIRYVQLFGRPLVSVGGFGWDWQHMLLPALVLSARPIAYLTRSTFLALNRTLTEDYVRTAWAKGLSLPQIFSDHLLRNVAVSILTAIGVSLRFALGTLPIVEFFFGWPGLGNRVLTAITRGEAQVVVVLALALGLTFLFINLLLDGLYHFIDPRLKENEA